MKITRIIAVLAVLVLAVCLFLTGCNNEKTPEVTTASENTTAAEGTTLTEETTTTEETTVEETTVEETTEEETTEEETTIPDVARQEVQEIPYASNFTVSKAFSNDMVVQRNEFIRVWGWADESENGKKISGEFMDMYAEGVVENGEWVITFTARQSANASTGNTMKIYTDKKTVEFKDVLIGDVYMVIGQSNTAYSVANHMQYCNNANQGGWDVLDFEAPIRLNYNTAGYTAGYPTRGTTETVKDVIDNSGWTKATRQNLYSFTAIGYYSAYHLLKLTDNKIPVGLIEIDGNGLPLGAFLPNDVAVANKTDKERSGNPGVYWTTGVNSESNPARYMYNHYMYAFEKYAMAGVIWYQGESDMQNTEALRYAKTFSDLMTYMRGTHNVLNKDFAVVMVEFPSIYPTNTSGGSNAYMDVGIIRGVMGSIPNQLSNSYMSASSDVWSDQDYWNSLHPNCKYEQGERVAKILASVNCGKTELDKATGPIAVSVEISEDAKSAVITFENVGEGLKTSDGGKTVKGISIFKKKLAINSRATVTAEITAPNQITVTSSSSIVGVGYNVITNYFYGDQINLCNSYDMPATAFMLYPAE